MNAGVREYSRNLPVHWIKKTHCVRKHTDYAIRIQIVSVEFLVMGPKSYIGNYLLVAEY
jgi:hypothetical protein